MICIAWRKAIGAISVLVAGSTFAAEPRDSGVQGPMEDLPQSIWQVGLDSTAHHVQTGVECPRGVGSFVAERMMVFDQFGLDVACNYANEYGDAVTLYMTQRNIQSLEDDVNRAKDEVAMFHPDMEPHLSTVNTPILALGRNWLSALYDWKAENAHSGIWIADYSGWTLKFRATYQVERAQGAFDAMTALVEAAEPARTHLESCARAPAPVRAGERIEASPLIHTLGTVGLAGHVASTDTPDPNPIWCLDRAVSDGPAAMLAWRNIADLGASSPVARLTILTMGTPPNFDVVLSRFASVVLNEGQADQAPQRLAYMLFTDAVGSPAVFALFDGEPPPEAIAAVVGDILRKDIGPTVYVGENGGFVLADPEKN